MGIKLTRMVRTGALALTSLAAAGAAYSQELADLEARIAALEGDLGGYVDNSFLFLIGGFLVMFMAAGFLCLEAGMVRKKNAAMQSMKNISLFSVSGIMFWAVGYTMAYPSAWIAGEWIGVTPAAYGMGNLEEVSDAGYSVGSDWFFQMVFAATAASIVSGTVAERVKLWPFLIFVAVLTGFIYPIVASWEWGTGALDDMGFSDFAGSTLVHSTGGWAALVGAIIIGPRAGKYFGKQTNPMPGSNIPLAGLGTFILWFGWFGFNGASQLAAAGVVGDGDITVNINAISQIFANTNTAAAGGVLAAMILTAVLYKGKVDATMAFNGAIGGLVAITAEPLTPSMPMALIIGAIGGVLVVLTVPLLDKFKIDDVVGAIPAHLVCGIWGTMAVPLTNSGASFGVQAIGVAACAVFVSVASAIVWLILKFTVGVRVSDEDQLEGLDKAEVGIEAYPEFG